MEEAGGLEPVYRALIDGDGEGAEWKQNGYRPGVYDPGMAEKWSGTEEGQQAAAIVDAEGSFGVELKVQAQLAWPMMLTNLLSFSFIIVSVMFVGHLGELELSSASIANSFANVTGFSVMIGLASALETLCGQAYGAKAYHLMGIHLQAASIVSYSFCIPIGTLWYNLETVLLWLGQDPDISRMAASYCRYTIPGLLSAALLQPLIRYLQTQSVVMPMMICSLFTALLHPLLCYLLIYQWGFGYHGGAFAMILSYWFLLIELLIYTKVSGRCSETWHGLQLKAAMKAVPLYFRLAVPSVVMICLEYWSFEILVLLSGTLPHPELELSLLSISLNTTNLAFMIPFGFSVAASTRVANALGRNQPNAAKLAVKTTLGMSLVQAVTIASVMLGIRNLWPHLFSDVPEVVNYVAEVMPLLALAVLLDGIQGVLSGVIRGCGRLILGATINLGAFYILGMPSAYIYGMKLGFGGKGLIMGLVSGLVLQSLLQLFFILRTDWRKMADEAQERVNRRSSEPVLPSYLEGLLENGS